MLVFVRTVIFSPFFIPFSFCVWVDFLVFFLLLWLMGWETLAIAQDGGTIAKP